MQFAIWRYVKEIQIKGKREVPRVVRNSTVIKFRIIFKESAISLNEISSTDFFLSPVEILT